MDSVLILRTEISVTNVDEVAELLQKKSSTTVAVCNANSLVRAYRDQKLQTKLNSFTVKAPDGFPVAKASKILYKNKQKRVDGFNIFHKTIEKGLNISVFKIDVSIQFNEFIFINEKFLFGYFLSTQSKSTTKKEIFFEEINKLTKNSILVHSEYGLCKFLDIGILFSKPQYSLFNS